MSSTSHTPTKAPFRRPDRGLLGAGLAFSALGALAIVLPALATLAVELLIAWLLVFWGIAGLVLAFSMRPALEWRYAGALFAIILALGLIFAIFPFAGIAVLTVVLMLVFLMEGIILTLLGLRFSGQLSGWRWMVFSGACSIAIGLLILLGWPDTAAWVLGLLLGVNFLSNGVSLIMLSRAMKVMTEF